MSESTKAIINFLKIEEKAEDNNNVIEFDYDDRTISDTLYYYNRDVTTPLFCIITQYFDAISTNTIKEKTIKDLIIIDKNSFFETVKQIDIGDNYSYIFKYKNIKIMLSLSCVLESNGKRVNSLLFTSKENTTIGEKEVIQYIFKESFKCSDLKGKSLTINEDSSWEVDKLEKRGYEDIFIPQSNIEEIKLYINIFEKNKILLRELFVGSPGTCKTESLLVIANELMKKGVTILKTESMSNINFVFEMAEYLKPSLVICDDIDLLLGNREKGMISKDLRMFLDQLDGTKKKSDNIGLIATTNCTSLLDLAAQRPGRFHKILAFGELTEDNILNIIKKSINKNFKKEKSIKEMIDVLTKEEIVKWFKDNNSTGSYIFNIIYMFGYRFLNNLLDNVKIIDLLNEDKKTLEKIKQYNFLSDNGIKEEKNIGFRK